MNDSSASREWGLSRWILFLAAAFALHVALIFVLGTKKPPSPRLISNVPNLTLASLDRTLLSIADPTLFALPHESLDYLPAEWLQAPPIPAPQWKKTFLQPFFDPPTEDIGNTFATHIQTNRPSTLAISFKPSPALSTPFAAFESALPPDTYLTLDGDLADRPLAYRPPLPSLPCDDVLPPTRLQLLVDATGTVISAIVLPPENPQETSAYTDADLQALSIARALKFSAAGAPTLGEITIHWRTEPTPTP